MSRACRIPAPRPRWVDNVHKYHTPSRRSRNQAICCLKENITKYSPFGKSQSNSTELRIRINAALKCFEQIELSMVSSRSTLSEFGMRQSRAHSSKCSTTRSLQGQGSQSSERQEERRFDASEVIEILGKCICDWCMRTYVYLLYTYILTISYNYIYILHTSACNDIHPEIPKAS
jgi:hypothetical protein